METPEIIEQIIRPVKQRSPHQRLQQVCERWSDLIGLALRDYLQQDREERGEEKTQLEDETIRVERRLRMRREDCP